MNIKLSNFGNKFSNRSLARDIFGGLESNIIINIDFLDVEEVTPSFFHELLEILVNEKKNKVSVSNLSDFLKLQLNKAKSSFVNK